MEKEKIVNLIKVSDNAFTEKSKYDELWRKAETYCGLNNEFYQQEQNNKKERIEVNNSTAIRAVEKSTQGILGILIGTFPFFDLKIKDDIKDRIETGDYEIMTDENEMPLPQEQIETEQPELPIITQEQAPTISEINKVIQKVAKRINEEIVQKNTNFTSLLEAMIKNYLTTGNVAIGTFKNQKDNTQYEQSELLFRLYTINDMAFTIGANGNITDLYMKYNWTAEQIVNILCLHNDGSINTKIYDNLTENIRNAYKNKNTQQRFKIRYILTHNPEKRTNATDGIFSCNWCGYWIDEQVKEVIKTEYYRQCPINVKRYGIVNNETYGKGIACSILEDIELINRVDGDSIECIENIVKPFLAMYSQAIDENSNGEITISRDNPLILNQPNSQTPNGSPIFPVIPQGNVSPVVQIIRPVLEQNIQEAFKTDIILDYLNKSQITATEIMERTNIRNKTLYYIILQFSNILNNIIHTSYSIIKEVMADEQKQKDDKKQLQKRAMGGQEPIYNTKDNGIKILNFLENIQPDWYEIEYNTEISQVMKNSQIQQIINYINSVKQTLANIPPEMAMDVIKRVDFNLINEKLDSLFNKQSLLIDKEVFEQMKQAEMMQAQQQAQQQAMTGEAQLNNLNSQTQKNIKEASVMQPKNIDNF